MTNRRKRSPFDNYRLKISTRIYEPELLRDFIAKGLEGFATTIRTQDGREVKVPLSAAFVKFFCRDKAREAYEKALKDVYGKEVDASEIFAALPNPW